MWLREALLAGDALHQQAVGSDANVVPGLGLAAVEQHRGAGRRLLAEGRAFAFDLLEQGDFRVAALADGDAVLAEQRQRPVGALELDLLPVVGLRFGSGDAFAVGSGAGQAAGIFDPAEVGITERDDLDADPAAAVELAGVFALEIEVRSGGARLRGRGEDRVFGGRESGEGEGGGDQDAFHGGRDQRGISLRV